MEENNNNLMPADESVAVRPKKSSKRVWLIVASVAVVLAVLSPFAFAMAKKMHLRNNPDLYILSAIDNAEPYKSGTAEITADIQSDGDLNEELGIIADVLPKLKIVVTSSNLNDAAKGDEAVLESRYELFYNQETAADFKLAIGQNNSRLDVAGENLYVEGFGFGDLNVQQADVQRDLNELKALFRDDEINGIIRELFGSAALRETDVSDEKTGKKSDIIELNFSLKDVYQTIKKFVDVLDTNQALNSYFKKTATRFLDSIENSLNNSNFDFDSLNDVRKNIDSGDYIKEIQKSFAQLDQQLKVVFMLVNPVFNVDFYISDGKFARVVSDLSVKVPAMFTSESVSFSLKTDSYYSDYGVLSNVVKDEDSQVVVFEEGNNPYAAGEEFGEILGYKLLENPGFIKLVQDLWFLFPSDMFE